MCIRYDGKALLSLMQLVSLNLPIGGFSYSKGLEWAIECGWINSAETFTDWHVQWIDGVLVYLDWPMLRRCYYYVQVKDLVHFLKCVSVILSYRDTCEFRLEEQQRGKAITQLIKEWYDPSIVDDNWMLALQSSGLAAMAWLGYTRGISLMSLSLGYAYNVLESAITVGLKLALFGEKIAQTLLKYLIELLPDALDRSLLIKNSELGGSFPIQSIASMCHEVQYSRLFRS